MYDAVSSSAPSRMVTSIPPPSSEVGVSKSRGGGWPRGSTGRWPKATVSCVSAATDKPERKRLEEVVLVEADRLRDELSDRALLGR